MPRASEAVDRDFETDLLRLTMTPGLGPVLIGRLLEAFGGPEGVLRAAPSQLAGVRGIGRAKAARIAEGLAASGDAAAAERREMASRGVTLLVRGGPGYPPLLAEIEDAPPVLYVRGVLDAAGPHAFGVGVVGSRRCSAYGVEQAERFAGALAGAGVAIISGGARGIDAAAHRGALRTGGPTVAVLGCGLARDYPPEHAELFAEIAARGAEHADGAVISELPMRTPPNAENFPARNRIISGLSLGVLVIEAAARSGALITARVAAEEHGREVFALPGRVDAPGSVGGHGLIKAGGALLVTEPGDVVAGLESGARHVRAGTHAERFADPTKPAGDELFSERSEPDLGVLTQTQQQIVRALDGAMTPDELADAAGVDAATLRAELTMLEIVGRVRRAGTRIERA